VQFPASRRKTLFGETPNTTCGDAYAPQILRRATMVEISFALCFALSGRAYPDETTRGYATNFFSSTSFVPRRRGSYFT
jgi:hypothetical protein